MYKVNDLYNLIINNNLNYTEDVYSLKINIKFDKKSDDNFYIDLLKKIREYTEFTCEISTTKTTYFNKENINSPDNTIFKSAIKRHITKLKKMNMSFEYIIKLKKDFCWFISKTYLINLFNNPISNLEQISNIFSIYNFKLILICDYDKTISNQFVKICNTNNFIQENTHCKNIDSTKFNNRFTNINLNFDTHQLIPELFYFNTDFGLDDLISSLNFITILVSFFYLSNSCYILNDTIRCTFKGKKDTEINFTYDNIKTLDQLEIVTKNIYYLYKEAYSSNSFQSIAVIRNIIGLFLRDQCVMTAFDLLVKQSDNILKTFKSNLSVMALKDTDKYFSNRYTVFDFISNSNDSITKVVDGLINKMNTFYLSTVSTIVASLLLFFKDLNFGILKISLLLYSIYIFIFGLMNFLSSYESFKSCFIIYDKKLTAFEKIFVYGELDEFKKNYNPKKKFYKYFFINLILLIIILILCVYALLKFDNFKQFLEQLFSITPN